MTEPELFESRYRPHLDRVSRSFALCIRELREPLRSWTGLSYLICRLLDTVEDAPWDAPGAQQRAFDKLERFVCAAPATHDVAAWAESFPAAIDPGEQALLQDSHTLFAALHALPQEVYTALRDVALKMSCGMRYYAQAWQTDGNLTLVDLHDVNRYCYFVAGVVGELLTALFALSEPAYTPQPAVWVDAQHFGLFLQKVNLLKDQLKDEAEKRFLCPSRAALLQSLPAHAQGALRYITGLPPGAKGFRTFCAWSVFLGAASLPYIEADHRGVLRHKISREHTQALLQHIASMACDNQALTEAMNQALTLLPLGEGHADAPSLSDRAQQASEARRAWFFTLDHAPLGHAALSHLGMIPKPTPT